MEKNTESRKRMEDWLMLINAETEEELAELYESTDIPEVRETIDMLREMSDDEEIVKEAREREEYLKEQEALIDEAEREKKE